MLRPHDFKPVVLPVLRWARPREISSLAFIPQSQDSDPRRPGITPWGNLSQAEGRLQGGPSLWEFRTWRRGKTASASAVTWCTGSPGPQRGTTQPSDLGWSRGWGGPGVVGILQAEVRPSWQRDKVGAHIWEPEAQHRSGQCRWAGSRGRGCGLASGWRPGWKGY